MVEGLTELQAQVLVTLVEGYAAREGVKERLRALNEWEIARRSGYTEASFAEFQEHPARFAQLQALSVLQRLGLVTVWDHGGFYDAYVPTPTGATSVQSLNPEVAPEADPEVGPLVAMDTIVERLDEIIRLLRALNDKAGGA
ncbi:MAG: hypothetical protein QOF51_4200 [Chloroflexota bacterium]|jgi:hypothetical protein|nr:hypothetical protein [Chloroflexota bacterium]